MAEGAGAGVGVWGGSLEKELLTPVVGEQDRFMHTTDTAELFSW